MRSQLGEQPSALGQAAGPIFAPGVPYDSGGPFNSSKGSPGADSVAVGDVNGDGKLDLVVANVCVSATNCESGAVTVLLGVGDGTFGAPISYGSGGLGTNSVAIGDVNRDGKPDLVVTNKCPEDNINCQFGLLNSTVGVLLGKGDGTFQPAVTYSLGGYEASSVALGDVNGDGRPDLLVANACALIGGQCTNGSVSVLLGNGDGSFQAAVSYSSGGYQASSVVVADVNGDSKPDLLVTNFCPADDHKCQNHSVNGTIGVLLGNGDGTFQPAVTYNSGGVYAYFVAFGDVNGDGKLDLLVASYGVNSVQGILGVLLGNGDGTFQPAVRYNSGAYGAVSVALEDVNGDSKPDAVVLNQCIVNTGNCPNGVLGVLLGKGDGTFEPAMTYGATGFLATSLALGDFNGDGKPDVAVKNGFASNLSMGNGTVDVFLNIYGSPASTVTTVTSSLNPSAFGQSVTFSATVTSQGTGTPTGTVTFSDGSTPLGTSSLSGGMATFVTASLSVGTHSITATYVGNANFSRSTSALLSQVVTVASTTCSLTSSTQYFYKGQHIKFTAMVGPSLDRFPNWKGHLRRQRIFPVCVGNCNASARASITYGCTALNPPPTVD